MSKILCLDIGGSSIKSGICSNKLELSNTEVLKTSNLEQEFMNIIIEHIKSILNKEKIDAISICIPGITNVKNKLITKCSSYPFLVNINFYKILYDLFQIPIFIENDANCAALSEASYGKYKNYQDIVFLIIGTGLGGSIVKNKKIHYGKNMYAGEFGCMYFIVNGNLKKLSHLASIGSCVNKIKKLYPNEVWNGRKLFAEADKGNLDCLKILSEFYYYLSLCILNIQHMYDPDIFLIGGGVSEREGLKLNLNNSIEDLMKTINDKSLVKPNIDIISFNKHANLLGAYKNAIDDIENFSNKKIE